MDRPQDPAGPYVANPSPTPLQRQEMIAELAAFPQCLRVAVTDLNPEQWEQKYRNWTVRQIVNHLADSHMNGYIRFKLTLTEDRPTIKPYDESRWSELTEAKTTEGQISLQLLEALHRRWSHVLRQMTEEDFRRAYFHPEYKTVVSLGEALGVYAWHGRHHLAQIKRVVG
jgi:uncharacterized damage-inducible protein DinB